MKCVDLNDLAIAIMVSIPAYWVVLVNGYLGRSVVRKRLERKETMSRGLNVGEHSSLGSIGCNRIRGSWIFKHFVLLLWFTITTKQKRNCVLSPLQRIEKTKSDTRTTKVICWATS